MTDHLILMPTGQVAPDLAQSGPEARFVGRDEANITGHAGWILTSKQVAVINIPAPDVSWAGFARAIFARSGLSPQVVDIPTSAYPTPARRPLNSRLDCNAISRDFGIPRPDWREGLDRVIQELSA